MNTSDLHTSDLHNSDHLSQDELNQIHNELDNIEQNIEQNSDFNIEQNSDFNINRYQENLHQPYMNFNRDIDLDLFVNPLIFHHDYDTKFKYYDIGKKVLAPKFLLYKLSSYDNIEYPIHIRINNTIFTVHEFYDDIDSLYIPTPLFYNIFLEENSVHPVTILKNIPPKATFLKMKPNTEELYKIQNPKKYLEIHFTKLYATVHKYEVIRVPYLDNFIEFTITDCKPENIVSLNEIEELEIELEPLIEKKLEFDFEDDDELSDNDTELIDDENSKETIEDNKTEKEENKVFVSFSGKGNRLGN